jgi:2,4-dienoyl-CoA reductase (NADPH2)
MAMAFPLIVEPIQVGTRRLPNRIVMGSMHTGLEGEPERFGELARFYADRAKGGAGLIVTGGFSPNHAGRIKDHPCNFDSRETIANHRRITDAVHDQGGCIILQLLHAGRYSYHSAPVAPSPIKSPINRDAPSELSGDDVRQTIADYASSTALALEAGYDGVEIMGSEGYLISQFLATRTNHRMDEWGGDLAARARFPIEVVKATRRELGSTGILSYRISALDLIEGGLNQDEIAWLAKELEDAGADCFMTGIGWHESPIPTIAGVVPHAAFADAAANIKNAVSVPVIASNRINSPDVAEQVLRNSLADMVSMARPFLADADFVNKALSGNQRAINVCIACNQACLDHYFTNEIATCLVNPRAIRELEFNDAPAPKAKKVAVVGAGVAGIACALEAAKRGHAVTLYEQGGQIGGQFILAARIPGKEDYGKAIGSFEHQLDQAGVQTVLNASVSPDELAEQAYDDIVVSTGITPRALDIPGANDPRVVGYKEVLEGSAKVGGQVLIIGGGGIGHDVALFLAHPDDGEADKLAHFKQHWGIEQERSPPAGRRQVTMLKRSDGPFGRTLGKSTGWILRQELRDYGVRQLASVTYLKIDESGLHILNGAENEVLPADTIVVCAGQDANAELVGQLEERGCSVHSIGGARLAGELDAKRAMAEGAAIGNQL